MNDPNGIMVFKQEGYFYSAYGNDALIVNRYLNYKLMSERKKTGFPVKGLERVLVKLDELGIDYKIIDSRGDVVTSKRFKDNAYEIIETENTTEDSVEKDIKATKQLYKDKLIQDILLLKGLSEGIDAFTGEIIENLSNEAKSRLRDISLYFINKLENKRKIEENYPRQGEQWSSDEDKNLIDEYDSGKTITELCELHQRGYNAIKSRLLKFGIYKFNENKILEDYKTGVKDSNKEQQNISCEDIQNELGLIPRESKIEVFKNNEWKKATYLSFESRENGFIVWVDLNGMQCFYKYPSSFVSFLNIHTVDEIVYTCHECLKFGDNGCEFPQPNICEDFMPNSNFFETNKKFWPEDCDATAFRKGYRR